jgi:hypothetical protein
LMLYLFDFNTFFLHPLRSQKWIRLYPQSMPLFHFVEFKSVL